MTRIDSMEQYELETNGYNDTYCVLFLRRESPPCLVMERILSILCDKNNIKLLIISVDNKDFFSLIEKYNVGALPRYLFINGNDILYTSVGTTNMNIMEAYIKKLEV